MHKFARKGKLLELLNPRRDEPDASNHGCGRPGVDFGYNARTEFEIALASMHHEVACIASFALQTK
jgi:hypothetical protein